MAKTDVRTMRLSPVDQAQFDALCQKWGCTQSDAWRRMLHGSLIEPQITVLCGPVALVGSTYALAKFESIARAETRPSETLDVELAWGDETYTGRYAPHKSTFVRHAIERCEWVLGLCSDQDRTLMLRWLHRFKSLLGD